MENKKPSVPIARDDRFEWLAAENKLGWLSKRVVLAAEKSRVPNNDRTEVWSIDH